LTANLQRTWNTLSKPAELKDRELTDYFDLSFTALPHKLFAAKKFESDARTLRARFTDKSRNDFVFKPVYHKCVPADGLAFYMEGIWVRSLVTSASRSLTSLLHVFKEQVQANKHLNLPTQQELLAQSRCDEILADALTESIDRAMLEKQLIVAGQVVNGLGEKMRGWRSQALCA
jgi:protein SEY1